MYIKQLTSDFESTVSLSNKGCVSLAELKQPKYLPRAEQTSSGLSRLAQNGAEQNRLAQRKADQPRAEQSRPLSNRAKLSSWRGAWPQGSLTALLFSQLCCITLSCFALNKVSFFTTPQTEDSCWQGIVANDHPLTCHFFLLSLFTCRWEKTYFPESSRFQKVLCPA